MYDIIRHVTYATHVGFSNMEECAPTEGVS
jgi:hypothetical protein